MIYIIIGGATVRYRNTLTIVLLTGHKILSSVNPTAGEYSARLAMKSLYI